MTDFSRPSITELLVNPLTPESSSALAVPVLLNTNLAVSALTGLSLVGASSSTSSSTSLSFTDVVRSLDQVAGTITLNNGSAITDLTTPLGPLQQTYNLVELSNQYVSQFQKISGTLNLSQGTATGQINLGDGTGDRPGTINFANLLSTYAGDFVDSLSGTVPFQNGKVAIDLPTPFGEVTGTIDFATGKLISDLTTPFGDLDFSIDFPQGTKFDLPLNLPVVGRVPGVLDLNKGVFEVDVTPMMAGPEFTVPLSAFSGSIDFRKGQPDVINISLGGSSLGSFSTTIDLGQETREALSEFLTSVTGTLGVSNGSLTAAITSSVGNFQGTLNAAKYATDFIATLPNYNGTITFSGGTVVANLSTPSGPLTGTFDYKQYLNGVALLIGDLGLA